MRWPATSAAAGRIRKSRRRSPRGKADPNREGGRGPLRGGLARRRGGRARAVAGRPARGRRAAGGAGRPARSAPAARRATPPTSSCPGCSTRRSCARPHAHARVKGITSRERARSAGRPRRDRPGRGRTMLTDEPGYQGQAVAAIAADTLRPGARRARRSIEVEWEVLEPLLDPDEAVARGQLVERAEPVRARRRRQGARRGRRRRRGRVPDADRAPQLVRDAPVDLRVAGRRARRLHLDAVHLGRPRRGRGGARPPAGQGARRLRVHGRRLRLEERRGRLHVHRRRAREADGTAGALRADPARGEPRSRQPQRDDPAADRRRDARTGRSSRSAAST